MPDLGKYGTEVLSAYGVSLVLIVAIVALTWAQARRAKRRLDEAEARRGR
ncbi:MAG: heme exporter protein CcmD [Pseudomonadota bacterium]